MKQERITSDEQLRRWVDGESVHRIDDRIHGGECCPDFSCCEPALLAEPEIRKAFAAADRKGRNAFLGTFLGALLEYRGKADRVHICTGEAPQ